VHSSIYDEFLSAFIKKASSHKLGDPFDPETYSGPQISKAHLDRIDGYVKSGVSEGAKIVLGGNRVHKVKKFNAEGQWIEGGNFFEPTIFVDATPSMKIVKEEIVRIHFSSRDELIS
jgi:aldehyde dehydrogenase (NAD+)